jgi:hypothetical protein
MKVYCLNEVYGDGDGYASFSLVGVFNTENIARNRATLILKKKLKIMAGSKISLLENRYGIINSNMTKENGYCMLAHLKDSIENESAEYNYFGGFVIYETEVIDK